MSSSRFDPGRGYFIYFLFLLWKGLFLACVPSSKKKRAPENVPMPFNRPSCWYTPILGGFLFLEKMDENEVTFRSFDRLERVMATFFDQAEAAIKKQIEKGVSELDLQQRLDFLRAGRDFMQSASDLNKKHAKQSVLVSEFVETIKHNILNKDSQINSELMSDQVKLFNEQFRNLEGEYKRISNDFFGAAEGK